ncbi:MAG: 3-phosphoshikimate 1-carboxyvinyltransferase [Nitrosomonadales bacterium]|jgi:3-phosphoshikimate 1-carboxyvinyltransferase|nr:3-phosphoshikimate 1-carboxyvinyltransferase [Nitrosomonadales bacterium]MBT7690374.1 3-phosphoshikimate 1-carboxyvinyltransferase [Nitrosomonadales bacterium]
MREKFLKASTHVHGCIKLPGSKSITNRILLMSSLGSGTTKIINPLRSEDTDQMINALVKLGVKINESNKNSDAKNDPFIEIKGASHNFPNKNTKLFLGNSGTTFRPLTAVLAMMKGNYYLSGIERMHERPIKDLVNALEQMGSDIQYEKIQGYPPIAIKNSLIKFSKPIQIKGDISSQYLTALLVAGPISKDDFTIEIIGDLISKPYINITLKLLEKFNIFYENKNWRSFTLKKDSVYQNPNEILVEGDASSASYFFAAAALAGSIEIQGINQDSIQGDLKFLDIIAKMGAEVEYKSNSIQVSKAKSLKGLEIDCIEIPDAAMTLAIMAVFADNPTKLKNIGSWRVKETDRILAMENELTKLGVQVSSTQDSITIFPQKDLNDNVSISTYNDHRIAMCFSLFCLRNLNITILDPSCVNKTYPDYFKDLESVIG